jgi:hypothetical protein
LNKLELNKKAYNILNERQISCFYVRGDVMGKYIRIFFLTIIVSVVFFFIFSSAYVGNRSPEEISVYTFGTIIVILLSFLISQIYYLIDLINKKG